MAEDMGMGVPPPEESGNRMFLIGAIILGGVFVVALISIFALYFLTRPSTPAVPQPQNQTSTAAALPGITQTANAGATQTRFAVVMQSTEVIPTLTVVSTITRTPTATVTPVVFSTIVLRTATPTGAQAAGSGTRTSTPRATALPNTGLGDSGGFPALLLLGGGSLLVIILARQMRLGRARG